MEKKMQILAYCFRTQIFKKILLFFADLIEKIKDVLVKSYIDLLDHIFLFSMQPGIEAEKSRLKQEFAKRYYVPSAQSNSAQKEEKEKDLRYSSLVPLHRRENSYSQPKKTNEGQEAVEKMIRELSFSHHKEESCMCGDCNCGRHLCKLTSKKADIKKQTIYQKTFKPQRYTQSFIVKPIDTEPLKGNHLDFKTEYFKQYDNRKIEKTERIKPEDTLKFSGPPQTITTYGTFHPGHRGGNQYVKPTDKHRIGESPLLGQSVYSTEFIQKRQSKEGNLKNPDSLRTGSDWMGTSTYNRNFRKHNPQQVIRSNSNPFQIAETYEKKPDFSHQFRTIYRNQFQQKLSPLCPSKIQLDRTESPQPMKNKDFFRENSDFRSMSPELKPFSTSKHFYV